VECSGLIEQATTLLRRTANPRIQIHLPTRSEKPWLVHVDAGQLLQGLMNLGLNVCEALTDAGELTWELANFSFVATDAEPPRRAGDFVRVGLGAGGVGLRLEKLVHFFERHPTTGHSAKAPGPAVTAIFNFLADQGGWIEAENSGESGARFYIYLPRTVESETGRRKSHDSTTRFDRVAVPLPAQQPRERILVIDDEDLVRKVIRAVLAYRGYQITEAANAEEGLRFYTQAPEQYQLVVMDLHLPGLNGREALLQIRRHNPSARAILLSGSLPENETALELRGIRFLQKPFDNQGLVQLVRETLDSPVPV
jgi:CheY-like chemotaxis protein